MAVEEYEAQNFGKETLTPGTVWRLPENQVLNYLCEIADLLRCVAAANGAKLSDFGLHHLGSVVNRLPRIKSEEEMRQESRDRENKLFGDVADGVARIKG